MPSTFTGTSGDDTITLSPNNAAAVLTLNGVASNISKLATLTLQPLGGSDNIEIGLIPATAANAIAINLALANGKPDGVADTVTFDEAGANSFILLPSGSTGVQVATFGSTSLAQTTVTGQDASDRLVFNLGATTDNFDGHRVGGHLVVNGGDGDNSIIGSTGADTLNGGVGQDQITTGGGDDKVSTGGGDDKISTDLALAGHATGDGGVGFDTLTIVSGPAADTHADTIVVSASGGHLLASEGAAASIDLVNMEGLSIRPGAGADTITIGDLTSAGISRIEIDLGGSSGIDPDGKVDTVNLTAPPPGGTVTTTLGADGHSEHLDISLNGVVIQTVDITNMDAFDVVHVAAPAAPLSASHLFDNGFLF